MSHKKLGQIIIDLRKENVETGEPRPVSSSLQKYLLEIKKYIVNTQIVNNLNVLQDSKNISLLIWDDNASMGKLLNANLTVEDVGTIRIYAVDYIALTSDVLQVMNYEITIDDIESFITTNLFVQDNS